MNPVDHDSELVRKAVTAGLFGPRALCQETQEFSLRPGAPNGSASDAPLSAPPVPDRYRIVRQLGAGGFGIVYLAHDEVLDRPVALKFLTEARRSDVERFRREARFTARLDDPHIVKVYELDENDGAPYIAMQYIDGKSLTSARLPLDRLLACMRDVGQALARAHAEGIVHRDLKPENILVDRTARPYLTDFGIARDLFSSETTSLSLDGTIIGTPALMPPEQARGEQQAIDARSDVYAFGATLYVMSTGRMPFHGENTVDILHAVLHDEPPLPRSLVPTLPRALETLIMKCLRKRKSDRYSTMRNVIEQLEQIIAGDEPVESVWFRRLVGAPESTRPTTQPDSELGMALEVSRELSSWSVNLYRVTGDLSPSYRKLDALIERLDDILVEHPDFAWARFYRGVASMRRGRFLQAVDDMECSIDRMANREEAFFELGRLYLALYLQEHHVAQKHLNHIGVEYHLGDVEDYLQKASAALDEVSLPSRNDIDPPSLPLWQLRFADAVHALANREHDRCERICAEILADDPDLEEVWKLRGDALRFSGRDPLDAYDRAVDIRRSYFEALYAKAEVLLDNGDVAGAREHGERVLQITSEFVEARALLAHCYMLEAKALANADSHRLREHFDHAIETLGLNRDDAQHHYELQCAFAELSMELGELGLEAATQDALDALDRAKCLNGCQNRVNLLVARALIVRSQHSIDPRADLQKVLDYRSANSMSYDQTPGWIEAFEIAERRLAEL